MYCKTSFSLKSRLCVRLYALALVELKNSVQMKTKQNTSKNTNDMFFPFLMSSVYDCSLISEVCV